MSRLSLSLSGLSPIFHTDGLYHLPYVPHFPLHLTGFDNQDLTFGQVVPKYSGLDYYSRLFLDQGHQDMTLQQALLEPGHQPPCPLHPSDHEGIGPGQHRPIKPTALSQPESRLGNISDEPCF